MKTQSPQLSGSAGRGRLALPVLGRLAERVTQQ